MTDGSVTVTTSPQARAPLPAWRLLGYGGPAAPLAILALPVLVFVPTLYAQEVGLHPGVISLVLLATRAWDMVSDPLVGFASDSTRSPLGRRRTWMIGGAPFLMIAAWCLFSPPENAGALYLTLSLIGVYTFGTMLIVPMNAWGAELSDDTHERTRIVAVRTGFGLAGVLAALIIPATMGLGTDDVAEWTRLVAIMGLVILPFGVAAACLSAPDHSRPAPKRPAASWRAAAARMARELASEPPLRRLLIAFFINMTATGVPSTLFLLFAKHKLGAPDMAGLWLVLFFGSSVLSLPFWPWLSKRVGKREAWIAGMLTASGFFFVAPFLGPGQLGLYTFIVVATGLCAGANLTLPASMLADLVERDAQRTGGSRAGVYFAVWGSVSKLSGVVGGAFAFATLGLFAFDAQSVNVGAPLYALAAAYGLAPALLNLAAAAVLSGYRLEPAAAPEPAPSSVAP